MSFVTPNLYNQLLISIVPTLFFTLNIAVDVYENVSLKYKLKGALNGFLCSYFFVVIFQHTIFGVINYFFSGLLSRQLLLVIEYIVYLSVILFFCKMMQLVIKQYNLIPGVKKKEPFFGVFLYAQYMVMVYISLCIADSVIGFVVVVSVLAYTWYLIFKKKLSPMSYIYPKELVSIPNVSLLFEFIIVLMLWFLPATLLISDNNSLHYYLQWIVVLSLLMYLFCICLHNVIFNYILHQSNEESALIHDTLTGLATRLYFLKEGQKIIENADGNKTAIIFINIKNFKYYNQNFGDEEGDKILSDIALILKKLFGEKSLIARLSDDHFAVLTKDYVFLADKLSALDFAIESEFENYFLKARVGVFMTGEGVDKILDALDYAIRASKGANSDDHVAIQYYDAQIMEKERKDEYIIANIDNAINNGEIQVFYQPIFGIPENEYVSAEALVRWDSKPYGFLPPSDFIPLLEDNNLIYKIDCYCLEQICKDHLKAIERGVEPIPVSFNISRKDFYVMDMVDYTDKILQKYNMSKSMIKVEITESALINNEEIMGNQIKKFHEHGYKVWMDDFGAGYSSLNLIGNFNFDGLKLDLIFLRNINREKIEVMRGVVTVAKNLRVEVLAEGVETNEHLDILKNIGCGKAQGYYFSRPIKFEEYITLLNFNRGGLNEK